MPAIKSHKPNLKSRAMSLVRSLPKDSSWDDLMYRIYVRQKIEAGLADLRAGRVHSHESIRREFRLSA
jgi:predicted transcriptional regulator